MINKFYKWCLLILFLITAAFQFVTIRLGLDDIEDICKNSNIHILKNLTNLGSDGDRWDVIGIIGVLLMFISIVYPLIFSALLMSWQKKD